MAALSAQQITNFARQAGFTGEGLAKIVAIALAESGGDPAAHNGNGENSFGLTQINVAPNANPQMAQKYDLSNPVENLRAAFEISGGGTNFGAWTTFTGATPSGRTGNAYQYMAQTYQLAGLDPAQAPKAPWGGGTTTSTTQGSGTQPGQKTKLPSDTKLYQVDGQGLFAVYDEGGILLRFSIDPSQVDIGGLQAKRVSSADWNGMQTVNAPGGAAELDSVAKDYGTFDAYFGHTLEQLLPPNSPAIMDRGVRGVIAQIAANPALLDSPTAIQQMLEKTPWYQSQTNQARTYSGSSQAQQKQMVAEEAVNLAKLYSDRTGEQIDMNDPRIQAWALDVASGKRGEGQILYEEILPRARVNPDSPYAQEQRDQAQHSFGNQVSDKQSQVESLFAQWGIQSSPDIVNQWSNDLVNGKKSEGDLMSYLQDQARILYPWKDPTTPTKDAAQPWMSAYQQVLEQEPKDGLQDPLIQKALNNGTPLWQFKQELRQDPRWAQTDGARDEMTSAFSTAGRLMGFS